MSFVIVDIETTGLSREEHAITEIAAAKYENGQIIEEYQTLINPQTHIPSFITKLTGITDDMVKDAPLIEHALPEFLSFIGDATFVGHNATFDYGFLAHNARKHKLAFDANLLCTCRMANRLIPDIHSKRLGVLCDHFGINNNQAHRALSDVRATVQLFDIFYKKLQEHQISDIPNMIKFTKTPPKKVAQIMQFCLA